MIVEKQMECRLAGETEILGENLPQRHFCPFVLLDRERNTTYSVISDRVRAHQGYWQPQFQRNVIRIQHMELN
jgi:hypothetical protein